MNKVVARLISAAVTVCMLTASAAVSVFAENEFEDIEYNWAKNEIEALVDAGIFSGVTQYKFEPNASVTRGMLAVVVCRMLEVDPGDRVAFFKDVDNNKYYGAAIAWTYENDILSGYDDMTFRADDPVTRQEMFCVFERVLRYENKSSEPSSGYKIDFADKEDISAYAVDAITYFAEMGYINGNENNMINPGENATRAEMCSLVAKLMGLAEVTKPADKKTEESTEKQTDESQEASSEKSTEKASAVNETEEKQTEETTSSENKSENKTTDENSPRTLLRNYKCVVSSYNDSSGKEALRLTYIKRGTEYGCYVKINGVTELYISPASKQLFEKTSAGKLKMYIDLYDRFDEIYGNILDENIENIDFLKEYTDKLDLSSSPEISLQDNYSLPGFVAKLHLLNDADMKKLTVSTRDGEISKDFNIAKDVFVQIVGGEDVFYEDAECTRVCDFSDYMEDGTDMKLFVISE